MFKKVIISIIIIVLFLIQIYAGFIGQGRDTWPFMNYPMYAEKHQIGDKAIQFHMYGHTASGKVVEITSDEDFGLPFWGFRRQAWPELLNPETRESYASKLLTIYNQRQRDPSQKLRGLQFIIESRTVTKDGPSAINRETLFTYNLKQ